MIELIYAITALLTFLGSAFLGIFVYVRDKKSSLHLSYLLMSISVALWGLGLFVCHSSSSLHNALIWNRFLHAAAAFIPVTYFHFILELLHQKKERKKILITGYVFSFILVLFSPTSLLIKNMTPKFWFRLWPVPGPIYPLFLLLFFVYFSYSFYLTFIRHRKATGFKRNQLKYIILGMVVGAVGGSTNYPLFYDIKIIPVGNFFVFFYIILYAYAIIKYHLMDIKIALTRAVLIFTVYALVLGIPLYVGYRYYAWKISTYLAILLATAGPFIYNRLRRRAEDIILAEQFCYQKALKDFASTLIFIKDVDKLTKKVVSEIMDSISLNFCAIYLKQDGNFALSASKSKDSFKLPSKVDANSRFIKELKESNLPLLKEYLLEFEEAKIGLACPLLLNRNLSGFIVLGQKEKKQIFTSTDLDMFSILSGQTSLALSEIYYFKAYQKATEQRHKVELEKARLESAFEIAEAYRHEVGNIINVISMSLMNLSSAGGVEPAKEDIEEARTSISRSVKRANYIFDAVARYNENANSQFQPQKLDKLISGTLEEYKEQIAKQNIKLLLNLEKEIKVEANNNLLFALGYLIKNAITAIEYTKPKEKLIKIELTNKNKKAILKVSDTGGDVNQDKLYKGIGIERGKEGGILYFLARRIIFDHQGDFQVSSLDDKKGTVFTIKLSLYKG